jgi:hypothetical protein
MMHRLWSDNQVSVWPFTYCRDTYGKPFGVILDSGSEEYPGCHLRLRGFGHTVLIELPPVVRPWRQKVQAGWDAATVARLGRDWYWNIYPREYGFQINQGGFLQVFLGRQTHDSITEQSWSMHLPFTQWRHVRFSLYDPEGNHVWTQFDSARVGGFDAFSAQRQAVERCPSVSFEFDDYDGERITARAHIEEREWRFGAGWFRWLSLFRRARVRRALDLQFSKETGPQKGSWKGGTMGHGLDLLPGETIEAGFRRYCAGHRMTFVGRV